MTYLEPQPGDDHADKAADLDFKRECHRPRVRCTVSCRWRSHGRHLSWLRKMEDLLDEEDDRDWDNLEREEQF